MTDASTALDELREENEALRRENRRLQGLAAEAQATLQEPEEIVRAIREGEIDALVVGEGGREEIYAIQRYAAVYRELVEESLPYGVWLADENGKLIHVSRQFLECAQTNLEEMREKGQFHFLPDEMQRIYAARWQRCLETGAPCDFEYRLQRADGSERIIWTHGILTRGYDGTPCWAGINLDVTEHRAVQEELRRKAEQLEEADRRKDEFLALLGHELRNPMAVIHHGLYLLETTDCDPGKCRRVLGPMVNQMKHLRRLVDDLLDISRISRGTIELRKQRVELASAVRHAVASVQSLIDAEGHQLRVSLPDEPVFLAADPTRLEQILGNLLNNAAKYTKAGGLLELEASREGGEVAIHVRDTGIGIAPEALPRIFDMFEQSDHSLDRSQGGLGVGLSIVRKLVELHDGSVTAHSEGSGRGSDFAVRLPVLLDSPANPPTSAPNAGGVTASARVRVLIAEDSDELAQLLEMLVGTWGYEVHVTHDGRSVLEAYRAHAPDVLLLDVGLPELDGYEVARRIRADHLHKQPVLVAVTGYGQDVDRLRARAAGFDHHLVKPADTEELRRILASAEGTPERGLDDS